jgi:hypothetical protein
MTRSLLVKTLALGAGLLGAGLAQAGANVYWSIGVGLPGVPVVGTVSNAPPAVVAMPPVLYAPAVVQAPPVVYAPRPVVVVPAHVVYAPAAYASPYGHYPVRWARHYRPHRAAGYAYAPYRR